jgi:dienelactone hydrolase
MRTLYSKWMYAWEHKLTTRDTNRIVRPLEYGLEFTRAWPIKGKPSLPDDLTSLSPAASEELLREMNRAIVADSDHFYNYQTPTDFRIEERVPELFPTNRRQNKQEQRLQQLAAKGKLRPAQFLRFTSPVQTPYPENNVCNARWFPAKRPGKAAVIVLPQWNADAFSHNALCTILNRFGISALRMSKPYHDIRRPAELERSDYAVSANLGRTMDACRQAVTDIRSCLDWLEQQGYEKFGVLGTSLGSCYAFVASAHDARIKVNAFNHASTLFADVVWTGQSTRHIRAAFDGNLTLEGLRELWMGISPLAFMDKFAANHKKALVVYGRYDLTFLPEFSQQVVEEFRKRALDFTLRVLPCGHYTTGETPYKFMDGWHLCKFILGAFQQV